MSSVIYLLRSPSQVISPALFRNSNSTLVISIEDTSLPAKVVKTTPRCSLREGEGLSYGQLMGLLVETEKVVTL
jgi:hypothetical protein